MKIAIPSNSPGLDGSVGNRLGTAAYLVIVESENMSFEAQDLPAENGPGAGVAAMSQAVESGAKALLTGHVSPQIAAALEKMGVEVVMDVTGQVRQAVLDYLASKVLPEESEPIKPDGAVGTQIHEASPWAEAAQKGARQFYVMLPRLIGVILLLGLLQGFISQERMLSLFPNSPALDALWGGVFGSILAGNPINSYVIGDSLLKAGVSLAGPLALMMAWVTVGMLQLPVEAQALGIRFTVARNLGGFIVAVLFSFAIGSWL